MIRVVLVSLATMLMVALSARAETDFAQVFVKLDKDGDNRLSRDEWKGPPQRFDKVDKDQDGFLSADEFVAARSAAGQRSCEDCLQTWRDCMIGKAGSVKHRCDAGLEKCRAAASCTAD